MLCNILNLDLYIFSCDALMSEKPSKYFDKSRASVVRVLNRFKPPATDHSKAMLVLWFILIIIVGPFVFFFDFLFALLKIIWWSSTWKWAPSWENLIMPYANNKAGDQPAHSRNLISAFVIHCLYSIIPLISISEILSIYLAFVVAQAGLSLPWSQTPKTGFLVTRLKYLSAFLAFHLFCFILDASRSWCLCSYPVWWFRQDGEFDCSGFWSLLSSSYFYCWQRKQLAKMKPNREFI